MKSYELYYGRYEQDGIKYYRQGYNWWEKGGYFIPQTKKKISEAEFKKMTAKCQGCPNYTPTGADNLVRCRHCKGDNCI